MPEAGQCCPPSGLARHWLTLMVSPASGAGCQVEARARQCARVSEFAGGCIGLGRQCSSHVWMLWSYHPPPPGTPT